MPKSSSTDVASASTRELIHALATPSPAYEQLAALNQLANIFATQGPAQLLRATVPPATAPLALPLAATAPSAAESSKV
jgi:hypothetical protein